MQIKNLEINEKKVEECVELSGFGQAVVCLVGFALSIPCFMALYHLGDKIGINSPLHFYQMKVAEPNEYYDFTFDNGEEYFINKEDIVAAIPNSAYAYDLGIKKDENGNAIVVKNEDIDETVDHILAACSKEYDKEKDKTTVKLDTPAEVKVVKGYHFITREDKEYDVKKSDIVEAYNHRKMFNNKIILTASQDGSSDTIEYTKTK